MPVSGYPNLPMVCTIIPDSPKLLHVFTLIQVPCFNLVEGQELDPYNHQLALDSFKLFLAAFLELLQYADFPVDGVFVFLAVIAARNFPR